MKSPIRDKFYAVITNNEQKIYFDWQSCQKAIKGVSNAIYKKFNNKSDAENFINNVISSKIVTTSDTDVNIFTDGSGSNGGGFGVVILYPLQNGGVDIYKAYGKLPDSDNLNIGKTSQSAELYAIFIALSLVEDVKEQINIYTDSQYSLSMLSGLYKKGKTMANKELIEQIIKQLENKNVKFQHVSAHKGIKYNEECDQLARLGASNLDGLIITKNDEIL